VEIHWRLSTEAQPPPEGHHRTVHQSSLGKAARTQRRSDFRCLARSAAARGRLDYWIANRTAIPTTGHGIAPALRYGSESAAAWSVTTDVPHGIGHSERKWFRPLNVKRLAQRCCAWFTFRQRHWQRCRFSPRSSCTS